MGSAATALAQGTLLACRAIRGLRRCKSKGRSMLYLRTASGGFVNAATIVQLSPQRGEGTDEITSWVAICGDGKAVALAAYYAVPGRIQKVVDFMPAVDAGVITRADRKRVPIS